jgi:hypothetical protein
MNNTFEDKFNEYITSINNLMYTFEITKCCGYSTFITIYKDESLGDLYKKVAYHMGGEVIGLFYITPLSEHKRVPLTNIPIYQFIRDNITCNPVKLAPVYPLPSPIVYKIYLNDGSHCFSNHSSMENHCQNIGYNCNRNLGR